MGGGPGCLNLGDRLGLDQFRLITTRSERQRRRGGEGAVGGDGGRRYTATQTGAGQPNRSFATGGGRTGKTTGAPDVPYLQTKPPSVGPKTPERWEVHL